MNKQDAKKELHQARKMVTRFEVIDLSDAEADRCLVRHGVDVELSYQDNGQTLKVFLTDKEVDDEDTNSGKS